MKRMKKNVFVVDLQQLGHKHTLAVFSTLDKATCAMWIYAGYHEINCYTKATEVTNSYVEFQNGDMLTINIKPIWTSVKDFANAFIGDINVAKKQAEKIKNELIKA